MYCKLKNKYCKLQFQAISKEVISKQHFSHIAVLVETITRYKPRPILLYFSKFTFLNNKIRLLLEILKVNFLLKLSFSQSFWQIRSPIDIHVPRNFIQRQSDSNGFPYCNLGIWAALCSGQTWNCAPFSTSAPFYRVTLLNDI